MQLHVFTRSAGSYGANTTYRLAGRFLQNRLGDYGAAITAIEVTACFRGGRVRHPSLQPSHDEFHSTFLPSLPAVKFFRKKKRVDLTYETEVTDATLLETYGRVAVGTFSRVLVEVAGKLHLIDVRLKKSDAFDLACFHRDITTAVASAPRTEDELGALQSRLEAAERDRAAAMGPWERLDVEWDEFHPAARSLLDDPFFWESANDHAPHGNDTGADLLSDFKEWNRRHPRQPAHEMARQLLRAWNMAGIDLKAVDVPTVERLLQDNATALTVTDDAMIAVAFAAVKLRGCCDGDTKDLALKAMQRERLVAVISSRGWNSATERVNTLDVMASLLQRVPEFPPSV